MNKIALKEGKIILYPETIEYFAKKKGFDLKCKIEEDGIKIDFEKEVIGFDLPVHILIKDIEIEKYLLKIKKYKMLLGSISIPPISLVPFLKKYKFIAVDMEKNIIIINLKDLIQKNVELNIDKILLKKGEIEIILNNLTISLSNKETI